MNLYDKCTKNEIKLIKEAGINVENKDYTKEELKRVETNIVEYILNHSSKNNEINKLNSEYDRIFRIIDAL